jgi:hypothetical protein
MHELLLLVIDCSFACLTSPNLRQQSAVLAGVIAFEAVSSTPAFGIDKRREVMACALGERAYIWEQSDSACTSGSGASRSAFERSRVRHIVLQCLAREAGRRPSACKLVRAIDQISNTTGSAEAAGRPTADAHAAVKGAKRPHTT